MTVATDRIGGPKPTSRLIVRPDPRNSLAIYAAWVGSGQNYTLLWGDGSDPTPMTPMRPAARHLYASAGRYLVTGITVDNQQSKQTWIELPWPQPGPKLAFRASELSVGVMWPATMPADRWRVHWPGWEPEVIDKPTPDEWIDVPCLPGQHTIHVEQLSTGAATTSDPLEVSDKPRGSVTADIVIQGHTVSVRRTGPTDPDNGTAGRPWWVFWGDEWSLDGVARRATPMVDNEAVHTYSAPGIYQLEIASSYRGLVYLGVWEVSIG